MMNMVTRMGMPIIERRPALNLGYRRPILGQSSVLDNRVVGFLTNGLATALGVTAGISLRGGWRTVGWIVAFAAGIRAWNDFSALTRS